MAYHLPKAWSPAWAVPQYVKDEGLERHAFVTLEVPDGTYDNPPVGSGGYVVPQYVLDEGYGQGAYITAWAPRGTYYGQKIPNWLNEPGNVVTKQQPAKGGGTQYTLKALGDADGRMPARFEQYGHRAAGLILSRVAALPKPQRKGALRRTLDAVDPSLWRRAQAIAQRHIARGAAPAVAVRHGIARAMSTGLAAEVIRAGRTGKKPPARSQLGLGCYGCVGFLGALGAVPTAATSGALAFTPIAATAAPPSATTAGGLAAGTCTADGQFIWQINGTTGSWRRKLANESCVATSSIQPTPTRTGGGGISMDAWPLGTGDVATQGPGGTATPLKLLAPPARLTYVVTDPSKVPADAAAYLGQLLRSNPENGANMITDWSTRWSNPAPGAVDANNNPIQPQPVAQGTYNAWMARFGIAPGTPIYNNFLKFNGTTANQGMGGQLPVAIFTNPRDGKEWGIWLPLWNATDPQSRPGFDSPVNMFVMIDAMDANQAAWSHRAFNTVSGILSGLADLACKAIAGSGGVSAGAAAGGAPGAAGTIIAQQACGTQPPAPTPQPVASGPSWTLPLLIGGAGLAAVLLITRKKKPDAR